MTWSYKISRIACQNLTKFYMLQIRLALQKQNKLFGHLCKNSIMVFNKVYRICKNIL